MYGLNYSSARPNKNIYTYATVSLAKLSFKLSVLSLSDICVRYPLSPVYDLLYYLIISSLIFNVPILFSFLLKALLLPSIWLIISFS